jgi:hypothetical protein
MAAGDQIVYGLYIAGNTGITVGAATVGATPECLSKRFALQDDPSIADAFGRAVRYFAGKLKDNPPVAIYVEGVVPENMLFAKGASNHASMMTRIGLYGAIIGVARAKDIHVIPVSIARVRTHFLGKVHKLDGPAAKRAIFRRCESLGWNPPDLDASDSAAIWDFGTAQVRFGALENM